MALPCPGPAPISLLDIQNEFGGTADTQIAEYYRGGVYVANTTTNVNIPTSGPISFDDFFCSVAELVIFITTNTANLDVRALFEATYPGSWTSTAPKRLVINSGVIVYNTNPYTISNLNGYALRIFDTFNGNFTLQNFGSIQGAAGRVGGDSIISGESRTNSSNGGQGGNAIYIGPTTYGGTANSRTVFIDNQGTIYAGGGGGGKGGTYTSQPGNGQYNSGSVSLVTTVNGNEFGGGGQGFNQSTTAPYIQITRYNFVFQNQNFQNFRLQFPPYSTVLIQNYSAYTRNMYFSSNSDITLNQNISGIGNINSAGYICDGTSQSGNQRLDYGFYGANIYVLGGVTISGANSTFRFNQTSSGLFRLYKDPNQSYFTDGVLNKAPSFPDNIYSVSNISGLADQPASTIFLNGAWGTISTTLTAVGTILTGGGGGQGGSFGQNGGNGSATGGSAGYAILGRSTYVSYINQGTIAGLTN